MKHVPVADVLEGARELGPDDLRDWLGEAKFAEMRAEVSIRRIGWGEAFVRALKPDDATRLRKSSHYPVAQNNPEALYRALSYLLLS